MQEGEVVLGHKYRDTITGFEGVAIAAHEYISACRRITLITKTADDLKEFTFDEPQLELVSEAAKQYPQGAKPGGDRPDPPRRSIR